MRAAVLVLLTFTSWNCSFKTEDPSIPIPPKMQPQPRDFKVLEYVPSGGPSRSLELFLPDQRSGEPLLIFVHGGAWVSGSASTYRPLAELFKRHGFAVALVDYRLSSSGELQFPSHSQDVASAYAFLVTASKSYGYSDAKIVVMGHSAGAHTAGILATSRFLEKAGVPQKSLPRGFVGLEGIYDLPSLDQKWPAYRDWFLSKAFGDPSGWKSASPTERKPLLKTPWLIVHSKRDQLVDIGQSEAFDQHLRKSGVDVHLLLLQDGDHDGVVTAVSTDGSLVFKSVLAALKAWSGS